MTTMVAALVVLVLQNLSPPLSLVVLGTPTVALPMSLWLLGAIAAGVLLTLITYQLVPTKRAYRPIGQRLSEPAPEPPNRFTDSPSEPVSSQYGRQPIGKDPYDSDWETFRAPEQWDDWGSDQRQPYTSESSYSQPYSDAPRSSTGDAVSDTVRDIETGWGDDDYEASARYASRQDAGPDMGWDDGNEPERPSPRTYDEGWLYGNDSEPPASVEPEESPDDSEDVYDANYRVIIPPYDSKDKDS